MKHDCHLQKYEGDVDSYSLASWAVETMVALNARIKPVDDDHAALKAAVEKAIEELARWCVNIRRTISSGDWDIV